MMEGSIHPNRFTVIEDPRVIEVLNKGIQSIMIAEKSAERVAEDIQKMKDKKKHTSFLHSINCLGADFGLQR